MRRTAGWNGLRRRGGGALLVALAIAIGVALAMVPASAWAQAETKVPPPVAGAPTLAVERITVHGAALKGSLEGDAAERTVLVVLPPSYARAPGRRYPVLYALHGYSIGAEQWVREIHVPQTVASAFARGVPEMIVVIPDAKTRHNGSMYSRSPTTGDFETFVARDLVAAIDARYRTVPDRRARGLAGHSMGGYGTARIGMAHPEVFSALYMMSPCCLSARGADGFDPALAAQLEAVRTPEEAAALPFFARATLASAAAWSPNPAAAPFFLDLPTAGGRPRADVLAKWAANAPLAMLDQHVADLRRYRAIAIDVGDQDGLRDDARRLHEALDRWGIANSFAVYPGTHVSDVAFRFQDQVLPFFGRALQR
jgi:enterochelin esterase-like enzyme